MRHMHPKNVRKHIRTLIGQARFIRRFYKPAPDVEQAYWETMNLVTRYRQFAKGAPRA